MASKCPEVDAKERLMEEYKAWNANHPENFILANAMILFTSGEALRQGKEYTDAINPPLYKGFIAQPSKDSYGGLDLLSWKCAVPGKDKTPWEGALYRLNVEFPEDYPYSPPKCQFEPPIFHPNVFPSGTVCLSLIDRDIGWKPQITLKEVLVGIQLLLSDPNFDNPAQAEAFAVYFKSPSDYEKRVSKQAVEMAKN